MDDLNVFIPWKLNNINGFQGAGKINIPHLKKSVSIDPKGQIYQKKVEKKKGKKKITKWGKKGDFSCIQSSFSVLSKEQLQPFFFNVLVFNLKQSLKNIIGMPGCLFKKTLVNLSKFCYLIQYFVKRLNSFK